MDEPSPAEIAVDAFLDRLLRGEGEDPEAFLDAHPELDPAEAARVRKLARVLGRGPGRAPSPDALPFERLGAYRLLARLGAGGMGLVYLAEDERLGRQVALKILRPELAGAPEAAARFEREARAVARLQHEHIVRVFEAGRVGEVSFLAMELVPGTSLDERLAEARLAQRLLPPSALLRWGRDIARALAAAHAAGIVHRDVKPSNVRITPDGAARLLDFGLALDPDSATLSRTGQVHGTIFYVSPEQVAGGSRKVDARTDLWSLGVTLYEGLTGHRPFEGEHSEQVLYRIVTSEPVAPRVLVPGLARDVETVVLRTLEKDRERRYASAEALAEDLDALLEGRPVRVRPTGPVTRAWKWSRRKPAHATSLALGALLGVGGPLLFALVQARHAASLQRERDEADAQRTLALARASDLEEMTLFQGEAIGRIQPSELAEHLVENLRDEARAAWKEGGGSPEELDARLAQLDALLAGANTTNVAVAALRRDLLEPSIAAARTRFAEHPKVEGMLLHTIAGTCWSLGLADLALETQQASHEVLAAHVPPDDPDRLVAEANLGYYLFSAGRAEESEPLLEAAADGLARLHGEDDARTLSARENVAMLLRALGRFDECEAAMRAVLDARRRTFGDDDPDTLSSLANLGALLLSRERREEAAPLLQEAYERRRRTLGPGDQATLATANNLAVLERELGRTQEAQRVFHEARVAARASLGDRHPTTCFLLTGEAEMLAANGHLDEAAAQLEECLALEADVSGPLHADTLYVVCALAKVLRQQRRTDEAEALLGETYHAVCDGLGVTHAEAWNMARPWIQVLQELGRGDEALAVVRELGAAVRAQSGPEGALAQAILAAELRALSAAGRFSEGVAALEGARPAKPTSELITAANELFTAWERLGPSPERDAARARWDAAAPDAESGR